MVITEDSKIWFFSSFLLYFVDNDDDDDDDDDDNGVKGNDTYVLHHFNKTDQECVKGCSPSGVPYIEIRARPKFGECRVNGSPSPILCPRFSTFANLSRFEGFFCRVLNCCTESGRTMQICRIFTEVCRFS